ncbi:MAG: DciA family protein [candidate division WOR-3 bacterium]
MNEPVHISLIVKKIMGDVEKKLGENCFVEDINWEEIVGKELAKGSKLVGKKGKKLIVKVVDSCYMFELNRMKNIILEKVNLKSKFQVNDIKIIVSMEEF